MNLAALFYALNENGQYKVEKHKNNFVIFFKKEKPSFLDKLFKKTWEPIGLAINQSPYGSELDIKLLPDAYQKHGKALTMICKRDSQYPSTIAPYIQELSLLGVTVLHNLFSK